MTPPPSAARLAVDIGGTFTDVALEHAGRRHTLKTLTTPAAPEDGVMQGVRIILEQAGIDTSGGSPFRCIARRGSVGIRLAAPSTGRAAGKPIA